MVDKYLKENPKMKDEQYKPIEIYDDNDKFKKLTQKQTINTKEINNKESDENLYNAVIVDEAHEHNANMDLILTQMKYTTYYNNSIRLFIVSATMDDDEPIYRRYYRDINDNRLYPLNNDNRIKKLDRINIDRRIHISPPNELTRFEIKDIYKPNETVLEIVNNIIQTSTKGDILIFEPGQQEIINRVNELNKTIKQNNIIAVPYYSSMNDEKKTFIETLTKESLSKFQLDKNVNYDVADQDDLTKTKQNTYDRIIIVGTNIAEASLTLGTLRYVVETGTQKIGEYNHKTKTTDIVLTKISESSRIQRRGRVGRVSNGVVFYTYKKGSMENNKKQYNISISDISQSLFNLLKNNIIEEKKIKEDPNNINQININNLNNQIKKQYLINGKIFDYYGDKKYYDYDNQKAPSDYYQSGYDYKTLYDKNGEFYIIHPEELLFERDIFGQITNLKNINLIKINNFFNILENIYLLTFNNNDYEKTKYGLLIQKYYNECIKTLRLDFNLVLLYFASLVNEQDNKIEILICCLLTSTNINSYVSSYFTSKNKFRTNIDKIKLYYKSSISDFETIIDIFLRFLHFINILTKNKLFEYNYDKIQKTYNKEIIKFCKQNYFNLDTMYQILEKYLIYIKFNKEQNTQKILNIIKTSEIKTKIKSKSKTQNEIILDCLIFSNRYKITKYTDNKYINIFNKNKQIIPNITKFINSKNTTVSNKFLGLYIYYYQETTDNTISIVSLITTQQLKRNKIIKI
jgi:hypothetical protein